MNVYKAEFAEFKDNKKITQKPSNLDLLKDVEAHLDIKIGETSLPISEIQKFQEGYLINLNKESSNVLVDVLVEGQKVANGEIVVIDNELFVRVVKIKK